MANELELQVKAQLANADKIIDELKKAIEKGLYIGDQNWDKVLKRQHSTQMLLDQHGIQAASDELQKLFKSLSTFLLSLQPELTTVQHKINALTQQSLQKTQQLEKLENDRAKAAAAYVKTKNGGFRYDTKYAQQTFAKDIEKLRGYGITLDDNWNPYGAANSLNAIRKKVNETNLPSKFKTPQSYQKYLTDVINKLGYKVTDAGGIALSGKVDEEQAAAVKELDTNIKQLNTDIQKLDTQIDALQQKLAQQSAPQLNAEGTPSKSEPAPLIKEGLKLSADTGPRALAEAERQEAESARKAEQAERQRTAAIEDSTVATTEFTTSVDDDIEVQDRQTNAIGRAVTTFFGYQMVLRQLRKLWNIAIHTIQEMDRELTNQAIVTSLSREQTWQLVSTYQELAHQAGVTQTQIAQVTTEYLRQGESLQDALTLTKAAVAAATVAGISTTDSVKYLTTAIHGFKLEAEDALAVSDKFAALAAQAATNYEDLAIALSKVASQASLAGMSMDYTLALLTTGLDVTQEAPESIGTALKTVIARMREISDYGKTLEDDLSINQVQNALEVVGIQLTDVTGTLRSSENVLDELGRKWKDLSANQQAAVAKALAGTRQQSRLVAILDNYDKVIAQQEVSMNALGATTAQQVEYLQGMEAAMNRMQNAYQSFIEGIAKSQFFVDGLNFITNIIQKITSFLSTPAGKTALIAGIATILLRSETLLNKIRQGVSNLMQSLTHVAKIETDITKQKERQLEIQRQINGLSDFNKPTMNSRFEALTSVFRFGKGYRQRVKDAFANSAWNRKAAIANVSKDRLGFLDKDLKTLKDTVTTTRKQFGDIRSNIENIGTQTLKDKEKELELAERNLADFEVYNSKSLTAAERKYYFDLEATELEARARAKEIEDKLKNIRKEANEADANRREELQIQAASLESEKKKAEYAEQGAKSERLKLANRAHAEYDDTDLAMQNFVARVQGVTQAIAAAATIIGLVEQKVREWQEYPQQLAQQSLEEATKIQAKIYENSQLQTNLKKLSNRFSELSGAAIQTADSLKELKDVREQLLTELGLSKTEAAGISDEALLQRIESRNLQIEDENKQYLKDMRDVMSTASTGEFDWGNIMGTTASFAGAGAGLGGAIGLVAGATNPAAGAIGGAIGGLVGGVAGLITGIAQEVQRAKDRADAILKIQEELKTDEGLEKWQYYIKASFTDLQNVSDDLNKEIKSVYGQMIDSLSKEDMQALFERHGWNIDEAMANLAEALSKAGDDIHIINDQYSSYAQRIAAAKSAYNTILAAGDEETAEAFKTLNASYFFLDDMLGTTAQYLDTFKFRLGEVNTFLTFLKSQYGPEEAKRLGQLLFAAAANGEDVYSITDQNGQVILDDAEIREAFADMFARGQTRQSVAEFETQAASKVSDMRNTQAKWGTLTRAEQERFMAEHESFFTIPGARAAFLNGQDITPFLRIYEEKLQQQFQAAVDNAISATEIEIKGAVRDLQKEGYALNQNGEVTDLTGRVLNADELDNLTPKVKDFVEALRSLILERDELVDAGKRGDELFNLSLQEVIEKEQEQIEKLKAMYEKQEQVLVDSLNKRREAYEKYFDSLESQEAAADYGQQRDQIIESISRLSAGTDATSRNKVADLRKQLVQIEKEEAQRQTEEARQAVLDNIDSQIENIEKQFEDLLDNNKQLLSKLNENTRLQYLSYLETLGLTDAEKELTVQEARNLFRGIWSREGQSSFNNVEISSVAVPQSPTTTQDPQSIMNLTIGNQTEKVTLKQSDMQELIHEMFSWLNNHAGTHFIV